MSDDASNIATTEPPVLAPGHTFATVTDKISAIVLTRPVGMGWLLLVAVTGFLALMLVTAVGYLLAKGIGIWGNNIPIGWAFDIINFVWWIGIGHAGTFISAFLLLLRQDWRTSINRFAEAMTLFAVSCAGLFPLIHLGRPWVFYYILPYPNSMLMWPQFRSPLVWDVFAVSTYSLVSLLFWYTGLIPDMATLRDRSRNRVGRIVYGILSMGWRNSALHWHRYQIAYMLLAGLAAPLVISVHSIVGMDFAAGQVPGWHSTIFPPYFVAGAIFSGFAMVLTLAIPLRAVYGLQDFITERHIDNCAKMMLVTGLIVAYGYATEVFMGWVSGNEFEWFMTKNRVWTGPYWPSFWALILCNVAIPQLLWFRRIRINTKVLWAITIVVNVGMWLERYVIIVTSLHRDFIPSNWGMYYPTRWDWMTYIGSIGFFLFCILLFIRVLPAISIFEMRELVHITEEGAEAHGHAQAAGVAAAREAGH